MCRRADLARNPIPFVAGPMTIVLASRTPCRVTEDPRGEKRARAELQAFPPFAPRRPRPALSRQYMPSMLSRGPIRALIIVWSKTQCKRKNSCDLIF
jgi:hypothetical protein